MKTKSSLAVAIAALALAAFPMTTSAQARVNFGIEFDTRPVNRYYVSLGESYDVPYGDICQMHDAGVADGDMPTILYIYTHSQYSLRQIYSLRLRGATWENLSNWCGVPVYRDRGGPPYGNAYGYYRNGPGAHRIEHGRWRDDDRGHDGRGRNDDHGGGRHHEEHEGDD